ncbi:hypothetical protein DIPPA_22004 [Diplonema papillatum]|nr:hypothetical protein DIPPA_22004 [Diplonema papillatum]
MLAGGCACEGAANPPATPQTGGAQWSGALGTPRAPSLPPAYAAALERTPAPHLLRLVARRLLAEGSLWPGGAARAAAFEQAGAAAADWLQTALYHAQSPGPPGSPGLTLRVPQHVPLLAPVADDLSRMAAASAPAGVQFPSISRCHNVAMLHPFFTEAYPSFSPLF